MKRRKYKAGDRIFFECFDGTVDSAIVQSIEPSSYIDDKGKEIQYAWLNISDNTGVEDYNTLPYSDPRVKTMLKEFRKIDKATLEIRRIVLRLSIDFNNETIATALTQVAAEIIKK